MTSPPNAPKPMTKKPWGDDYVPDDRPWTFPPNALLPTEEEDKAAVLAELYAWTGSAWLAGEEDGDHRAELRSFLCRLFGWFLPDDSAMRALAKPDELKG